MSNDKKQNSNEELLRRLDKISSRADRQTQSSESAGTEDDVDLVAGLRHIVKAFNKAASVANKVWETGKYIATDWVKPAWDRIEPVLGWGWRGYKNLFNRVAHKEDDDGNRIFSKKRAAAMVMLTAAFGFWGVNTGLPIAMHTIYDGTALTIAQIQHKEGTIYLNKAQEIDAENDVHQTSGCYKFPCDPSETMYFRIRDNIILDINNWFTQGHAYYPEDVAGVIANETNKCDIKWYGVRNKTMGWYPYIYHAECTPISIQPGEELPKLPPADESRDISNLDSFGPASSGRPPKVAASFISPVKPDARLNGFTLS